MKRIGFFSVVMPLLAATALHAAPNRNPLVVTATNAAKNQLLVFDSTGTLIQTVSTQGQGGVSGNAGGIATKGNMVAVVNFGSQSVSIFHRTGKSLQMKQLVSTGSSPVSVAFGANHLYILGATKLESHRIEGSSVDSSPDGVVPLLVADGSSAQVGVLQNQLIVTEKTKTLETVNLMSDGSASGVPTLVQNIPATVDTPFGLVTRDNNAYVTIAHSDQTSLVRDGKILTLTGSGTEHSPCWLTLVGPFLYSSNSPSMTISRYAVYGQKVVQDAAVAARLGGAPTDIASGDGLVAVIDGSGHLSIFSVDEDGNLTLRSAPGVGAANGVAVVTRED